MKRTLLELCKSVLIAALAAAILFLALLAIPPKTLASAPWLAGLLRPFAGVFGLSETELTPALLPEPQGYAVAAQPVAISVLGPAGRYTAQQNFSRLDEAYEQLGSALGQALGTASEAQEVSVTALQLALQQTSVAFFYPSELPAGVLASWLDVSPQSLSAAWGYVLALEEDAVSLYLCSDSVYRLHTRLSPEILSTLTSSYGTDGSFFAFEDSSGLFSAADPLSLLSVSTSFPAYVAQNPCDARQTERLASFFGFNPYGDGRYADASGVNFYNDSGASLTVSASGRLIFRPAGQEERFSAEPTDEARIETARALAAELRAGLSADERLYLTGFEKSGSRAVCTFSYYLSGLQVCLPEGPALRAEFDGERLTLLEMTLRTYTATGGAHTILPAAQNAAISAPGVRLEVIYADAAEPRPGWSAN